jgi:hypothetical protein
MSRSTRAWALAALVLAGCPGTASFKRDGARYSDKGGALPIPDAGGWQVGDKPQPKKPDALAPKSDQPRPDLTLGTKAGDPCPCAKPLLCVLKACREPCTEVACNGTTTCQAGETCAPTKAGISVCVPGGATGAACSDTALCASGNLCLAKAGSAAQCFATCGGPGQPCAGGQSCTAIQNNPCHYCP